MSSTPPDGQIPMSYTGEIKPSGGPRPTEDQIRTRAHRIWLSRNGAHGNAALDWLQAEMELLAEMRAALPTSQIEPMPRPARTFARGDTPGRAAA